ncbi:MAG: hypothetical protein ACKVHQ_09835 [Gammaproteobacteria bacterium]|jgi:hypothetical protein
MENELTTLLLLGPVFGIFLFLYSDYLFDTVQKISRWNQIIKQNQSNHNSGKSLYPNVVFNTVSRERNPG